MAEKIIKHSKLTLGREEETAVIKVLRSGQLSEGPEVEHFEKEIASMAGVSQAVALSSGTAGLHLALLSLGVKKGDEVIMPSYVCQALLNAALYVGAKPVFADIRLEDYTIDPLSVKKKISSGTRAIIVPHMFGCMAEMANIKKIGIPILEDFTQALGAHLNGEMAGSLGDISIASFYATKIIASGEGGALLSRNREYTELARGLRDYSKPGKYEIRYNYKMTEIEAALARTQLNKLEQFIKARREIAKKYSDAFKNMKDLILPIEFKNKSHIFYRYLVRSSRPREEIKKAMATRNIEIGFGNRDELHRLYGVSGDFINTEIAGRTAFSLPIYPLLKTTEQNRIIKAVKDIFK